MFLTLIAISAMPDPRVRGGWAGAGIPQFEACPV